MLVSFLNSNRQKNLGQSKSCVIWIFLSWQTFWNHVQPRKMIKTVKETSILLRNQVFKEKHICQANLILEFLHQCNAMVSSTLLPYFCADSLAITTKSGLDFLCTHFLVCAMLASCFYWQNKTPKIIKTITFSFHTRPCNVIKLVDLKAIFL